MMSRPAGDPAGRPSASSAPLSEAIPDELCDHCGGLARHRVSVAYTTVHGVRRLGELMFCTHHYERHLPSLVAQGLRAA